MTGAGLASGLLLLATLLTGRRLTAVTGRARTRARLPDRSVGAGPGGSSVSAPALPAPAWLSARLRSADVGVEPGLVTGAWVGATVLGGLLALLVGGVTFAVMVTVGVVVGPVVLLGAFGDRADRRLEAALPEALEAIARALRGGASLPGALAEAGAATPGRLGDELGDLVASSAAGVHLVEALDGWAERHPLPAVRLAAAALALAAEAGGASARAVDGVAETVRGRLAVAAEVRALSAQARLSALVIVLAPLAFSVLTVASDEATTDFLFRTPAGLGCLLGGLTLDAVAAVWMRRLSAVEA